MLSIYLDTYVRRERGSPCGEGKRQRGIGTNLVDLGTSQSSSFGAGRVQEAQPPWRHAGEKIQIASLFPYLINLVFFSSYSWLR